MLNHDDLPRPDLIDPTMPEGVPPLPVPNERARHLP
jgi:hypothetical protein